MRASRRWGQGWGVGGVAASSARARGDRRAAACRGQAASARRAPGAGGDPCAGRFPLSGRRLPAHCLPAFLPAAPPLPCSAPQDGKWMHVKETTNIGEGKLFAPGNLRATFDNPAYERLISYYLGEKYTLR
jgi:hypothetical protein